MTRAVCIGLCIGLTACNQQPLPQWLAPPTAPTQPSNFIRELVVGQRAVFGGNSTQGSVALQQPVTVDTVIELTSSDDAISVPPSIVVRSGADTATFPITTKVVPLDLSATITASLDGRLHAAALRVWHLADNDIWYEREPSGIIAHHTSANATFGASCSENFLQVMLNQQDTFTFGALTISKLRPGRYEDARPGSSNVRPSLSIFLSGLPAVVCGFGETTGNFSIDELEVTRNTVRRFAATFEQHCLSNGNTIRGGVRLTSVPPPTANRVGCD